MAAFKASRLVWSATSRIRAAICLTLSERWERSSTVWLKRVTLSLTALILPAMSCISPRDCRAMSRLPWVESEMAWVLPETSWMARVLSLLAVNTVSVRRTCSRALFTVSSTRAFTSTASRAMLTDILRTSPMICRIFSAKRL